MGLSRILQSGLLVFVVLLGKGITALAADPPAATDTLNLLVTDANDKPVAGALVTVNSDGQSSKVTTSTDGHVLIPLPKQPASRAVA